MRPKCSIPSCRNRRESNGRRPRDGIRVYKRYCSFHRTYAVNYAKGDSCDFCGFVAKHSVQLHVDHIDGNNTNNNLDNLQTLCANCHALKTAENGDWRGSPEIIYDDRQKTFWQ